ncbi:MAG: hypothetical protein U0935_05970 [Pirellulales bacterium]
MLTGVSYFQGSLEEPAEDPRAVDLPLLRKDFILDEYQLLEARLAGTDAVLLIAECLDDCQLRAPQGAASPWGWRAGGDSTDDEPPRVLAAGALHRGCEQQEYAVSGRSGTYDPVERTGA